MTLDRKDAPLLDAGEAACFAKWRGHIEARGVVSPRAEDFESFGALWELERLGKVLNKVAPDQAAALRIALKRKRSERWRADNPVAETKENRKARVPAKISLAEDQLPRAWQRALGEMRVLRRTANEGMLALDERNPPSAKVIENLASTLRVFAKCCLDNDTPVEITRQNLDLWRAARFNAGNKHRSIATRLKELLIFAIWCECDDELIDRIGRLRLDYEQAGRGERKRKDAWMLENNVSVADVWEHAEELLELGLGSHLGTARRARTIRDAACLALSIACPLRCGDLHRISFGTHLRREDAFWELKITTAKTGTIYHRPALWPELTPFLDALLMLDLPASSLRDAAESKAGQQIFSLTGADSDLGVAWPSRCWRRHYGTGEHIVRTLWHDMMFESEDDEQWIALALCGQRGARTHLHYVVEGRHRRAARSGRAKIRNLRAASMRA